MKRGINNSYLSQGEHWNALMGVKTWLAENLSDTKESWSQQLMDNIFTDSTAFGKNCNVV